MANTSTVEKPADKIVYYEYGLAAVTSGLSSDLRRTLVRKIYLVAVGPRSVQGASRKILDDCVAAATSLGAGAAYTVPPPGEASARLAAAIVAFKGSLYGCLSAHSLSSKFFDQIELSLVTREIWENGIRVELNVESPSVQVYKSIYALEEANLPTTVRDAANVFIKILSAQDAISGLHVSLNLGDPVGDASNWITIRKEDAEAAYQRANNFESRNRYAIVVVAPAVALPAEAITALGNIPGAGNAVDKCKNNPVLCAASGGLSGVIPHF